MTLRQGVRLGVLTLAVLAGIIGGEREWTRRQEERAVRLTVQSSPEQVTATLGHPLRPHVRAFAADLAEHGMAPARARRLAPYIISLTAHFELPPALIFGVMLTENRGFVSTAVSTAGAMGLMQLMPGTHAGYARICGPDRANDISNVCAGIHVLAENLRRTRGDVHQALLRYNGCVRGTHTPNCFTYPTVVLRHAATARWVCPEADARVCLARRISWRDLPAEEGTL